MRTNHPAIVERLGLAALALAALACEVGPGSNPKFGVDPGVSGAAIGDDESSMTSDADAATTEGSGGARTGEDSAGSAPTGSAGTAADEGDAEESGTSSGAAEGPAADIDVTLEVCDLDFSGETNVTFSGGTLRIDTAGNGAGLLPGSFVFGFPGPDVYALSSQHTLDTGVVVEMLGDGTEVWTNFDENRDRIGDHVSGQVTVSEWDPLQGRAVVDLLGVTLVNGADEAYYCAIDGSVIAHRLGAP